MRLVSRSGAEASFREAVFAGLAPDGGLYHPVEWPDLSKLFASFNDRTSFKELAVACCAALLAPEIDARAADGIVSRAFTFQPELRRMDDRISLLELFHGPTAAFKDFGAQFLAASMEHFIQREGTRIQILVATSGDTGSAAANAFHNKKNIDVVILYPSGRVSELQEKQLTTLGGNVHALEVAGSFDDCQRMVKQAFRDETLRRGLRLTSANSINIGRLLPQSFYYIFAATRRKFLGGRKPVICVPSGNFGNLTAGVYAWRWGLEVASFIAATNVNDVVPRYLLSGVYNPRPSEKTLSNAMDVGNPSNFERLLEVFGGDWGAMKSMIRGLSVTDAETRDCMRKVHGSKGVFIDPHTAVGFAAAGKSLGEDGGAEIIVLSTAHPAKFLDIVRDATGASPEIPERLARCLALPKKSVRIGTDFGALSEFLLDAFG
jgi:threonine synthase